MDRVETMRVFVRVVETGSFSAVARTLGLGQPAISKQIAALEDRLGAQLIRRGSRGISLTEAGREFYDDALRILADLELAEARIGRRQVSPSGVLRVALSPGFGRLHVVPLLPAFLKRYPDIAIDFRISDRFVDLIEEGLDMAIRIGELADSSLVARRIAATSRIAVAAPAYLKAHGEPKHPNELARHAGIVVSNEGAPVTWQFAGPAGRSDVQPRPLLRTNDAEVARAAVLQGLGIGYTPHWLFAGDLKGRAVRQILKDQKSKLYPISAVYPGGRKPAGKVTAFIAFLAEAFAKDPSLALR